MRVNDYGLGAFKFDESSVVAHCNMRLELDQIYYPFDKKYESAQIFQI